MAEPLPMASSLASHDGQVVEVAGRYTVEDLGPHRVMVELPDGRYKSVRKIAHLELEDGGVVRLWDRPEDEIKACGGQRVVARGRLYIGEPARPDAASLTEAASLLEIERVERLIRHPRARRPWLNRCNRPLLVGRRLRLSCPGRKPSTTSSCAPSSTS